MVPFRVPAAAVLIACAFSSRAAAAVPAGSEIRVGPVIDLASFSRTISTRYDVVVRKAVTADIDRDGDLDVLTATDLGFDVWVNDGTGRLTAQAPQHQAPVDAAAPHDTFRDSESHEPPTAPTHLSLLTAPANRAHGPPAVADGRSLPLDPDLNRHDALGVQIPRAPPIA